jgi:hypothetical protein
VISTKALETQINRLTNLISKINTSTNKSSKAKNSNALRTLKGHKNSNKTNQEKNLKEKIQNKKISFSEH